MIVSASSRNLESILRTQLRLERLCGVRIVLLTVLAFDGAFVWVDAVWPKFASPRGGLFAILTWPVCFTFYLLVRLAEREAARQVHRLLEEEEPPAP